MSWYFNRLLLFTITIIISDQLLLIVQLLLCAPDPQYCTHNLYETIFLTNFAFCFSCCALSPARPRARGDRKDVKKKAQQQRAWLLSSVCLSRFQCWIRYFNFRIDWFFRLLRPIVHRWFPLWFIVCS